MLPVGSVRLGGLIFPDVPLNLIPMGADIGPRMNEVLGPQVWIGIQEVYITRPRTAVLL